MNSYIRIGEQSLDSFYKPCHLVEYYKYLRFFTDGKIIVFTLFTILFNPLSGNPTKSSDILKQFVGNLPTNCLSVSDHFVGLALKGFICWKHITDVAAYRLIGKSVMYLIRFI